MYQPDEVPGETVGATAASSVPLSLAEVLAAAAELQGLRLVKAAQLDGGFYSIPFVLEPSGDGAAPRPLALLFDAPGAPWLSAEAPPREPWGALKHRHLVLRGYRVLWLRPRALEGLSEASLRSAISEALLAPCSGDRERSPPPTPQASGAR